VEFKKRNPNIGEFETWAKIEHSTVTIERRISLCIYEYKEYKECWYSYSTFSKKLCVGVSQLSCQILNDLRDSYNQQSYTSIEQLMCIREICLQWLVSDIYDNIKQYYSMQVLQRSSEYIIVPRELPV
jgi:hypothetical protein